FHAVLVGEPGPQEIVLSFGGSGALEKAEPMKVTTDPAKSQIELAIGKLDDDPQGAKLRVTAAGEDGPVTIPVQLSIGLPGHDDLTPLRAVETGSEIVLTRKEAGGPGLHRLRAVFTGDDMRQAAKAEVTIELASTTITTMRLSTTQLAFEDDLKITGSVRDID